MLKLNTILIFVPILSSISPVISLVRILEQCQSNKECPSGAACHANGCGGYTCLCLKGFIANYDYTGCTSASFIGQPCQAGNKLCVSIMSTCTGGVCTCLLGFRKTINQRPSCIYGGGKGLGEVCNNNYDCADPYGICSNGICECESGYRAKTSDEFWANPILNDGCIPEESTLNKCGSVVLVIPSQVLAEMSSTLSSSFIDISSSVSSVIDISSSVSSVIFTQSTIATQPTDEYSSAIVTQSTYSYSSSVSEDSSPIINTPYFLSTSTMGQGVEPKSSLNVTTESESSFISVTQVQLSIEDTTSPALTSPAASLAASPISIDNCWFFIWFVILANSCSIGGTCMQI